MKDAKISIIVPIYKVEPHLRKCLGSLVNQTYTNLEIILVDDGSPDNCGAICDEYAEKDNRIIVIHKENGGVSSARNAGLDRATGEYIGWVDPDDWAELDMFEYMLLGATKAQAEIVMCGRYEEYPNRSVERGLKKEQVLTTTQAVALLLENNEIQNHLWDKLWKRELFQGIYFPKGRTYEDFSVLHKLFEKASTILYLPDAKYHYLQRSTSIISDSSLKNRFNYYLASKERYFEMKESWPQFEDLLESQCVSAAIGLWCRYYLNPKEERSIFLPKLQEIAAFAKSRYKSVLNTDVSLGMAGRLVLRLIPYPKWWAFSLATLVGLLYKKKNGRFL